MHAHLRFQLWDTLTQSLGDAVARSQYSLDSPMARGEAPHCMELSGLAQQYASRKLQTHHAPFLASPEGG